MPNQSSHGYDATEANLEAFHEEGRKETNALYRSSRPTNTVVAYKGKVKEWYSFCNVTYSVLPSERRYTVTADKIHTWLREDLMSREKKKGKKKSDESRGLLSHATLYAFVAGAIDLWNEQREAGINSNPHPAPRDGHVKKLLKMRQQHESQRKRQDYVDRGEGTALNAFTVADLSRCSKWCLEQSMKSPASWLRDRLALNLSVSCLLRGHSVRNAELPDFHVMHLPDEGSQTAYALCMVIDVDKTIKDGQKYLMGAMRARDYQVCTQGAFAMYAFYRWHIRYVNLQGSTHM